MKTKYVLLALLLGGCVTPGTMETIKHPYPPPTWTYMPTGIQMCSSQDGGLLSCKVEGKSEAEKDKEISQCDQERISARPGFTGLGKDQPITAKHAAAAVFVPPKEFESLMEDEMADRVFEGCMIKKGWIKHDGPRKAEW